MKCIHPENQFWASVVRSPNKHHQSTSMVNDAKQTESSCAVAQSAADIPTEDEKAKDN